MRPVILVAIFGLTCAVFSVVIIHRLEALMERELPDAMLAKREALYLPNGEGLRFMSFGYQNFLSNILWFDLISYFGKHYKSDQSYRWLAHMCGLVTDLDPRASAAYEFCGMMLAWEVASPRESITILDKAVNNIPESWRFRYLRGFTYLYFMQDEERAREDFQVAAGLPNAPAFLGTLAAKKMALSDPVSAIQFLVTILANTSDPTQRQALEGRLAEIAFGYQQAILQSAIDAYVSETGSSAMQLEDLFRTGHLQQNKWNELSRMSGSRVVPGGKGEALNGNDLRRGGT